jgi:hypothetical protein
MPGSICRITEANAIGNDTPMPIVDCRTAELLKVICMSEIEILPIVIDDKESVKNKFAILNIITTIDCIDFEKSKFIYFSSGSIMSYEKIAFKKEAVSDKNIFFALDVRPRHIFVSDVFRNLIINNQITGFEFDLEWDSEDENSVEAFRAAKKNERLKKEQEYRSLKKGAILNYDDDLLITVAIDWISSKITETSESIYAVISELPMPSQYFHSMFMAKIEMEEGGFIQLFYNNGIEIVELAAEGFKAAGQDELAGVIGEAARLYKELDLKYETLERNDDSDLEDFFGLYETSAFEALDERFNEAALKININEILIDYIKANSDSFGD